MRLSVTSNSKMRLSVECAFPHLGKRDAASRKSALCPDGLMEKRTLLALGVAECAFRSRRRPGGVEPNPPPACGALWKMAQLGKCARATPPPGCGGVVPGPAGLGLGPDRTERRSRSVHKSAKTASRRWFGAFVYTVASELRWVTRVSQPPWDACGTDGVLLQQGTHSTRREDQMCVACVYPAHFYLLALDARRGRCRCDVSESLTSQS